MSFLAARYMTRFRCLASDCPDDCCHGWRVVVDQQHHDRLRERLPAGEYDARLRRIAGGGPQRAALVVLDERGRCSFLEDAGLCSVQARFGEDHLPDGCASFPRRVGRLGQRYELAGSLSCPEVARMVLGDHDALDLVSSERAQFGRSLVHHRVEPHDETAFLRLREHLLGWLTHEGFSLPCRLFSVACAGLAEPIDLEEARVHLEGFVPPAPFAMSVVRALVLLPPLRPHAGAAGPPEDDLAALDEAHRRRPRPPLLDEWLTRYARHYILREWTVRAPSLGAYVLGLLVRIAALRYLVASHPEPSFEVARRAVTALTRLLEHDRPMADALVAELEAQGMNTLDHAACLALF